MAQARLEIVLQALNLAGSELQALERELGSVNQAAGEQPSVMKAAKLAWTEFNSALMVVQQGLGAVRRAFEFAQEGAALLRLQDAGEQLAASYNTSMGDIVAAVQRASLGTISEGDAIAAANRALMFGVADTAEEMGQLMEVAAFRARAMGISTSQAFSDIVTGIGRMSPLILDNLGIVTGGERAMEEYARSLGKTAEELTDTERRQALLNRVLATTLPLIEEAGGLAADAATSFERFGAASEDAGDRFKREFGEFLAPIVGRMADFLEHTNEVNDALDYLGYTEGRVSGAGRVFLDSQGQIVAREEEVVLALYDELRAQEEADGVRREAVRSIYGIGDAAAQAASQSSGLAVALGDVSSNLDAVIGRDIRNLDLIAAGWMDVQDQYQTVVDAYGRGQLSLEATRELLGQVQANALMVKVEAGDITFDEAARSLRDSLGVSLQEARDMLEEIRDRAQFDITSRVTILTHHRDFYETITQNPELAYTNRASGGPLGAITEVGEHGPEAVINGVVVDATTWAHLKRLGLSPNQHAYFGTDDVWGGHSTQTTTKAPYTGTSQAKKLPLSTNVLKTSGGSSQGTDAQTTQVTEAVTQAVVEVAQAAAAAAGASGAMAQAAIVQQAAQLRAQMQEQAASNNRVAALLESIYLVLVSQGTAFDTGRAVTEGIQTLGSR